MGWGVLKLPALSFNKMDSITICNLALLKLGNAGIVSFTDGTPQSNFCKLLFQPTLDEVMRSHEWSYAKAIVTLSQSSTPPVFDWSYSYQLPNDFARLIGFNNFSEDSPDLPFEIMGQSLLTDEATANIAYVRKITDPNLLDSISVELLALRLAQKLAQPLGRSTQMEQILVGEFQKTLEEARRIDYSTSNHVRRKPLWVNSDLVNSRWNGGFQGD